MSQSPNAVLANRSRLEELEGHVSGIYKKLDQMTDVLSRLVPATTPVETVSPLVPSTSAIRTR